jgi:dTDP-4-dehydrorhamnose 3,5-epimerase
MKIQTTPLKDLLIIEPRVFADERGFFFESFNLAVFARETGVTANFVQDNHSKSQKNVLRGLHYQINQPQGKLVRVVAGAVFDVALDIRGSSPTFGKWFGIELSAENRCQLWIPVGFAHGFVALSDGAEMLYKTTDYWASAHERTILWNDPELGIVWPVSGPPVMSVKDQCGLAFCNAQTYP